MINSSNIDLEIKTLAKNIPIEFFIQILRNLPDGLIEAKGIKMPFDSEDNLTIMFNHLRKLYRSKADWLAYYYGKSSLIEELQLTEKSHYKPDAEISRAWLNIIQETFLLSSELETEWKSPSLFWMFLEVERFFKLIRDCGISGNANPIAKRTHYALVRKVCNLLGDSNNLLKTSEITTSPTQYFCSHAMEICANSENVQFRNHWTNFLKTIKQNNRIIERSTLKNIYLDGCKIKQINVNRSSHNP